MYRLSRLVSITPVIRSSDAVLANEEVFWIVDILVWPGLYTVDYLYPHALANMRFRYSLPKVGINTYTRFQVY